MRQYAAAIYESSTMTCARIDLLEPRVLRCFLCFVGWLPYQELPDKHACTVLKEGLPEQTVSPECLSLNFICTIVHVER